MRLAASLSLVALVAACSSSDATNGAGDAGADGAFAQPDGAGAAQLEGGSLTDAAKGPRVTKHGGVVLPSMKLTAIYLGNEADGGLTHAPDQSAFLSWLLASDYWGLLQQYGVGKGALVTQVLVPLGDVLPASKIESGLIGQKDVADAIAQWLHPPPGADAGASYAGADAYAIFLPQGVNVVFPANQGTTCVTSAAYHDDDGIEPFAVFAPCAAGRSTQALAHELAEAATDPFGTGWFSDADVSNGGGEICDLCDVGITFQGHLVTQLWSDSAGSCAP